MKGKIIAIVGSPAVGKSFLAKILAREINAKCFLEGEEKDLPKRITFLLKHNKMNLELIIWFRNKLAKEIIEAKNLASKGKNVVLDTFWLSNKPYIESMPKGFEKQLALELLSLDRKFLPFPDLTIFLKATKHTISKLASKRKRSFELKKRNFIKNAIIIQKLHEKTFTKKSLKGKLITINRDSLDFGKEKDMKKLLKKLKFSKNK